MRLSTIRSGELLPGFVKYSWETDVLDLYVLEASRRAASLSAPWSFESIQALTGAEFQAWFEDFSLAPYYPDIPRPALERTLEALPAYLHKLGTPGAVKSMCRYIFGETPLEIRIIDNEGTSPAGEIVNYTLLDSYRIEFLVSPPTLSSAVISRIFNNLTKYGRDTQSLTGMQFIFDTGETSATLGAIPFMDIHVTADSGQALPGALTVGWIDAARDVTFPGEIGIMEA